jgi:hypothetical protein
LCKPLLILLIVINSPLNTKGYQINNDNNNKNNVIYFKIKDISSRLDSQRLNGFASYHADLQILWKKYYGKGGNEAVF